MEQKKLKGIHKQTEDVVISLEKVFKDLPHLPENIRQVLVSIAPWLALVFGILGVLAGIGRMGISPFTLFGGVRVGMTVFFSGLVTLASSILMLMAFPKLMKKSYTGWVYLFWSEALNAAFALLSISLGIVVSILLALYLLFEVKKYYK